MTAWLEPLGTHVCLPLTRILRQGHHALQVASVSGRATILENLELLCRAIHCVFHETAWALTFAKCVRSVRQGNFSAPLRTRKQ